MYSRDLSEAAQRKDWYRVGWIMMQRDLKGPQAKELIERDGYIVHWSSHYLRSMRRAVETIVECDVSDEVVARCPFCFARDVMRHFRTGEIEKEEMNTLIMRRARHIGPPEKMPLRNVRPKESVRKLLELIRKPQDDQEPQD